MGLRKRVGMKKIGVGRKFCPTLYKVHIHIHIHIHKTGVGLDQNPDPPILGLKPHIIPDGDR